MGEDLRDGTDRYGLTRRNVLVAGGAGAGALMLAACGASSDSTGGNATIGESEAPTAKPKPGGVLRVGLGGGSPSETFDAALVNGPAATTRDQVFYENLIWMNGTFGLENALIDEIAPNKNSDSYTVKLKPEVEFHNGKTVSADDVVFSMERIMDPKIGATASGQYINLLKSTKKIDDLTVRFDLKYSCVSFPALLSDVTYILPVGYDPENPVSTGPWKFVSFTPGEQTVLTRFENYWGPKALADELIMVELPDDTARVNAMLAGQVDAINQVPLVQATQLEGTANIDVVASETAGFNPITMRVDVAPFDDVRVRQAIKLLMSRQQAISAALNGQGQPASDYFGRFDEGFEGGPETEQDIEQAKSLLKQAGREDEAFELVTSNIAAGIVRACEVLAENAKSAGVNLKSKLVEPSSFFSRYGKWPFAIDFWVGLPYLVTASIANGPKATVVNTTHFNDPEFNKLFFQASKENDKGKREEIIKQMHVVENERGGFLIWSFQNTVDAYSSKLAGYDPVDRTAFGLSRCRLDKLGFV